MKQQLMLALLLSLSLVAVTLVDDTGDGLVIEADYPENVNVIEDIIIPSQLPFWIYPEDSTSGSVVTSTYTDFALGQHRYIIAADDTSNNPSVYDAIIESSDNLQIEMIRPSSGGFAQESRFRVEIQTSGPATCSWSFYAPGKNLNFQSMDSDDALMHEIQGFRDNYRFRNGEGIPIMFSCANPQGTQHRSIRVVGWAEQGSDFQAIMWPGEIARQGQKVRIDVLAPRPMQCSTAENPGTQTVGGDSALIQRYTELESSGPNFWQIICANEFGETLPEKQLPIIQNYSTSNIEVSIQYPLPTVRSLEQTIAVETNLESRCQVGDTFLASLEGGQTHFAKATLQPGSNELSVSCQGIGDGEGASGDATKTIVVDEQPPRVQLVSDPIKCGPSVVLDISHVGDDAPTHFIITTPEGPVLREWDSAQTQISIQQATQAAVGDDISIQGIDSAGNIGEERSYFIGPTEAGCEALGIEQQLTLESPTNGATNADSFTLVVDSELDSSCTYDIGSGAVDFPQTGQKRHVVQDFPAAAGLSRNKETTLTVRCTDAADQLTTKDFTLAWDLDDPVIQVSADPNPVLDAANRETTITVDADQSVRCQVDDDAFTPQEAMQHSFVRAVPYGSQSIDFVITCENLAGTQVSQSITVTENYPSQMTVSILAPDITSRANQGINVTTNLQAECILSPSTTLSSSTGQLHTGNANLQEGENTLEVTCTEQIQQRVVTESQTILLDTTAPDINVTSPPRTCTTNEILVYGTIEEANNLVNFTIEIFDETYDVSRDQDQWSFTLNNLNLTSGEEIPIYLQATDEAGVQGEYLNFEIIARNDGRGACDTEAPDVRLETQETSQGVEVSISCQDDQSGCDPVFRFGTGAEDGQCTLQTRNLNQDHTITLTETKKVCWEVKDYSGNLVSDRQVVEVVERPNHCFNNVQDGDETDLNCGGSCAACQSPDECSDNDDCNTGQICSSSNVCVTPTTNECNTDTDCFPGASCISNVCQFPAGEQCDSNTDCDFGSICSDGACYEDNTDTNNAACEEDIDCSPGEYCVEEECREPTAPSLSCSDTNPCPTGETCFDGTCWTVQTNDCSTNADCEAGSICEQNTCVEEAGPTCSENTDCSAGVCDTTGHCQVNSCENGIQDGQETGVDCGGSTCEACEAGAACEVRFDCTSKICGPDGTCIQGTCSDGIINNGEGGTDCGGPCSTLCELDETCRIGSDCESGFCTNGICTPTNEAGEDRGPRPELPGGEPGGDLTPEPEKSSLLGWIFIIFGLLMSLGGGGYIYWEEQHPPEEDSDVDVREDPFGSGFAGPTGPAPRQQTPQEDFATSKLREEARVKRQEKKKQNRKDLLGAFEDEDEPEEEEKQQDS